MGADIHNTVTFEDISSAAERIEGGIYHSPCPPSEPLSLLTGSEIYCKLDYLQRTGSFKERGARNALMLLPEDQKRAGVIAASAGNHALGLAYHGQLIGVPVTVVMPKFAPLTKVAACEQLGAQVVLHGDTFDEAQTHAHLVEHERGLVYIHGFNDAAIIAGQGTLGLEILDQVPDADAIIVPIGGGGLIAGVSLAAKTLRPDIAIIGVEPERAASFTAALAAGKPVDFPLTPTLADGLSVARVGERAFAIARKYVDRVVTVGESAIARSILRLIELEKSVVEGAGAAGLAACISGLVPELAGKKVVLPLCGGNIDTTVLGRIIERGLAADGRLSRFQVAISDRPGGLAKLATIIADAGASIVDIAHDRAFSGDDMNSVIVHCVVETRNVDHVRELHKRLAEAGLAVRVND